MDTGWGVLVGAVAAILGGVGGGALTGWYQDRRDNRDRPRLKLDFDVNADKVERTWEGISPFDGIVLRASLRNEGVTPALHCRVFITALTAIQSSGSTSTSFKDSRQISWTGWIFDPYWLRVPVRKGKEL